MMRLRVAVRRHGLPETPIIWSIDTNTSPTVYQLLEQINTIVPIETDGQWGLEDYAVELKGINGVNYECLHFQPVASVMKEEDEVIIRPLLTQDLKIRRISGRHQISDDGKRLYDGLALGRPLLRTPANRPAIDIPPRKKQRITYSEDDEDDEGFAALKGTEESDTAKSQQRLLDAELDDEDSEDDDDFAPAEEDSDLAEDSEADEEADNKKMVLHADLDDEDSANDEDFAPEEDQDENEDDDDDKQLVLHAEFDNADYQSDEEDEDLPPRDDDTDEEIDTSDQNGEDPKIQNNTLPTGPTSTSRVLEAEVEDNDEPALADISDLETRVKIRKLHSAFPKSHLAVCKYILNGKGVEGDIGEAYEVLARGFRPVKSKSEITETTEDHGKLSVRKARLKRKSKSKLNSPVVEMEDLDSMQVEAGEDANSVVEHYDQHGLPPGSITASGISNKSIKFGEKDEELSNGFISTPFIDNESQDVESSEDDSSHDSDDEDASSSSDSSDSSSDDTDEQVVDAMDDSTSSDDSGDSSSDSSSDDEAPEENSSKTTPHAVSRPPSLPSATAETSLKARPIVIQGAGKTSTRSRNTRRRNANLLERYKKKGILPAGTTLAELSQLRQVNSETSPEDAHAALATLRAQTGTTEVTKSAERVPPGVHGTPSRDAAKEEFERRRQELLSSLANGGVEVGLESPKKTQRVSIPAQILDPNQAQPSSSPTSEIVEVEQGVTSDARNRSSLCSKGSTTVTSNIADTSAIDIEDVRSSPAPGAPNGLDTPLPSPKPQPVSVHSNQNGPRRAKLDLGAGRRMLFGALGLKTPKTKKDEEKLKQDLMKDIKPLVTPKTIEKLEENINEVVDEDPEAWREKIIYRAVECVQEDIELSEPPFPFVQRWDPQQRWSQKGKRKKDQRDQGQNYNEDYRASKKQKHRKGKHAYAEEQEYREASGEMSYQDDSVMDSQFDESIQVPQHIDVDDKINQQFITDVQVPILDSLSSTDLVKLPEDPTSLPDLHDGEAKTGMTIALKKLEMSAETQWQPRISSYVTAKITAMADNGVFTLMLASRDQKQMKHYDEKTGERLYERFEVPDDDDEMEVEDEGTLYLSFGDLIEPKIVQQPPANLDNDILVECQRLRSPDHDDDMNEPPDANLTGDLTVKEKGQSADESTALGHGDDLPEAQLSHVTETPLNSDAPESYQEERQLEYHVGQQTESGDFYTEKLIAQEMGIEESPSKFHATDEMETRNLLIEEPVAQEPDAENITCDPVTPIGEVDELPSNFDLSAESVTEEAQQKIALMMKNAGFRSSVPSSILKDIRPDSMQSPGETASFERLRDDMDVVSGIKEDETGKESQTYSPKFNGLGSSPVIKPRQPPLASSPSIRQPSSSWETVERNYRSSPLPQGESSLLPYELEEQSNWVTIGQTRTEAEHSSPLFTLHRNSRPPASTLARPISPSDLDGVTQLYTLKALETVEPSNLPVPGVEKHVREKLKSATKVPVGKAQAYWQLFQQRKHKSDSDSDSNSESGSDSVKTSSKPSPERSPGFDGTEDNDVDSSVKYPKLPIGSSFNSQVTDHGRQPDFIFNESVVLSVDSPVLPDIEMDTAANSTSQQDHALEQNYSMANSNADTHKQVDPEAELSRPKKMLFTKTLPTLPSDDSDEDLPPLHELSRLSQRSATIKREKSDSVKSKRSTKVDLDYDKAMVTLDEESSEDQTTPKTSQKQRQALTAQASKFSTSVPHDSQPPRASQSKTFSVPAGSQVMDLTMSSDAEPEESEPAAEAEARSKPFRTYQNYSDDDEDYNDGTSGWAAKKSSTIKGVEPRRRQASGGLRHSSKGALNARIRR